MGRAKTILSGFLALAMSGVVAGCTPELALAEDAVSESEVTGEINQLSGEVSTLTGEVSATHEELGNAVSDLSQKTDDLGSGIDEKLENLSTSLADSSAKVDQTLEGQGKALEEIDSKAGQTLEAVRGLAEQEPQEVDDEWLRRSLTNIEQLLMLADACAGVVLGYLAFKRLWSSFFGG